jgi:phosphoribosylanthranilate isomerase
VFCVKICGVRVAADAEVAAEAGADAIGLNFYPRSPRCVGEAEARGVVRHLPAAVARVGVFVNAPADELQRLAEAVGLDLLQLHGDEPPELLAQLRGFRVIKAFRGPAASIDRVRAFLETARQLGCTPAAVLVDAYQPGVYGGTGHAVDWTQAAGLVSQLGGIPLVLAGGLTPGNVADAIRTVRPAAVDTASGVETEPGRKDPQAVRHFVHRARAAFLGAGLPEP